MILYMYSIFLNNWWYIADNLWIYSKSLEVIPTVPHHSSLVRSGYAVESHPSTPRRARPSYKARTRRHGAPLAPVMARAMGGFVGESGQVVGQWLQSWLPTKQWLTSGL